MNSHQPSPDTSSAHAHPRASRDDTPFRGDLLKGVLPAIPSERRTGSISPDGWLQLEYFDLPVADLIRDLHQASRLCIAVRSFFRGERNVNVILTPERLTDPPLSVPLSQSLGAIRRLLTDGDIEGRVYRWRRALDAETRGANFSQAEIEDLRSVLVESAYIASAVCALDAEVLRSSEQLKARMVDSARRKLGMRPTLRGRYRHALPFDEFAPPYLSFDLDKWAQRIRLAADGAPLVAEACALEHAAARTLTHGAFETTASTREGSLWGRAIIRKRGGGEVLYEIEVCVPQVFAVLTLAQSGGRFIAQHKREGINIARMCSMVDRTAGMDVAVHMRLIDKNTISRLDDLSEWALLFDVGKAIELSPDQSADLARLLIDAERVLSIMESVKGAFNAPAAQSRWSSMWTKAISDRDVKAGLRLMQSLDRIISCDFGQAAGLARSGIFALGYSLEDNVGAGWRIKVSPVQSLAWLFSQAGQVPNISPSR